MLNLKQNSKFYIGAVIVALVYCILFPIVSDILAGEGGKVRKIVMQAKKAVEDEDMLTCISLISDDYKDKYGNDKQSLVYLAREAFRYYDELFVQIETLKINLSEDKKEANIQISGVILGLKNEVKKEMVFEKEKGEIEIRLMKKDSGWQVIEIESFEPLDVIDKGIS